MGATNFDVIAHGEKAGEAFAQAVQDALYWSGHGGYTGTIAEKAGYMVFDVPLADLPYREVAREQWNQDGAGTTLVMVPAVAHQRLVEAIYWYNDASADEYDYSGGKQVVTKHDPWTRDMTDKNPPKWLTGDKLEKYHANNKKRDDEAKADARFFVDRMGEKQWKRMVEQYFSKWDEAVAVKIAENEWFFCGLASC